MNGAIAEIDELFRMTQSDAAASSSVSRVRGRCGVTLTQSVRQRGINDAAGPTTVSDGLKFTIPGRCRKPHFDLDFRIGARSERRRYTAKRRQIGNLLAV